MSFSAMRSSLRIGVLNMWTKSVPLIVKLMLPTPVRRSALDYSFGIGGSGRMPVESEVSGGIGTVGRNREDREESEGKCAWARGGPEVPALVPK